MHSGRRSRWRPAQCHSTNCFLVTAYCLLQWSIPTIADISATFSTATAVNTYIWTLADVTVGAGAGAASLTVSRGDPIILDYATTVSYALDSSVGTLQGSITVAVGGNCNPASTTLTSLQISVGSAAPVTVASGATCNPSCSVPFGPTTVNAARIPAPGVTQMTVRAVWNGQPDPGCPAATIPISWGTTTTKRPTATLSQNPSWPQWSLSTGSSLLASTPTVTVTGTGAGTNAAGTIPATYPATTTLTATDVSGTFSYAWTWTVNNINFCLAATAVGMTVELKADDFSATKAASTTITVQGCDQGIGVQVSDIQTQSTLTFAWTQNLVPEGPTSINVPWGSGATVPIRTTFTRTVTSAQFVFTTNIQLTNPERGPVLVSSLQLMCLWGPTVNLPCGTLSGGITGGLGTTGSAFGITAGLGTTGSAFVIPASQTITCPINNFPISATWGVDFTQPCKLVATNVYGKVTEVSPFTLNFASPTIATRINDCVLQTVTCTPGGGNLRWQPVVDGGPQGARICGLDNNAPIQDQRFSISLSGGWNGAGDQPGDCSPVTASCTSQLSLQSSGATVLGSSGGGPSSSLTITAVPTGCQLPVPSPVPTLVVPSPNPINPGFASTNGISATIKATGTSISGSFGWDIESSVTPGSQPIQLGGTGKATYKVRAIRGNLNDASPVTYFITAEITVTNTNTIPVGIAMVSAVLDAAKVPATCPTTFPAQMAPGAQLTCTVRVQYNRQTTPGLLDAEVVQSNTAVKVSADQQAPFHFSKADTSGADGTCAFVNVTFSANAGMSLQKLSDVGSPVLPVDGQTVRVCDTTRFQFDVEYAPSAPLTCGTQPVVSTATVIPDNANSSPVQQSSTTANITITDCSGPAEGALGSSSRIGGRTKVPTESGSTTGSGLSVTLGQVATAAADSAVWTLKLLPTGVPDSGLTKARDAELADGVKFRIVYSKSMEKVTKYSGDLTITNSAAQPVAIDSITVELVDTMSPSRASVSQVNVACLGPVSPSSTLSIPAGGKQTCSYAVTAKLGGELVATVTALERDDSVQSSPQAVKQFLSNGDEPACATLVSGVGVTSLVKDGTVFANVVGKTDAKEVCDSGTLEIVFPVPQTPNAACGTYPFLTIARLVPSSKTTASPVTASASVDITITGCSSSDQNLGTATVSKLNVVKSRTIKWSVKKTVDPAVTGNTLAYKSGGDDKVSVSVLYSRQYQDGVTLTLNGVIAVPAKDSTPLVSNTKVRIVPLCASGNNCSPSTLDAACGTTVNNGSVTCRFTYQGPLASGVVVPLTYTAAGQDISNPAQPAVYDPNTSSGRRSFGRCANLTDQQEITAPAKVEKSEEVNPPPADKPVCASSWLYTYKLRFSDVKCGQASDFTSQAKAAPVDAAAGAATAVLNFGVTCQ